MRPHFTRALRSCVSVFLRARAGASASFVFFYFLMASDLQMHLMVF
jgi:hypothetical protein